VKRREFIALLGGAAASPLAARAQQPANAPTIGFVGSDTPDPYEDRLRAFRLGLRSTGFVEGHNLTVDYRWAEGRNDKLAELTADLVRRQVAVIVAPTTPAVLVAKAANADRCMFRGTSPTAETLGSAARGSKSCPIAGQRSQEPQQQE